MTRRQHRMLGVLLAIPLILWMVTGLLFHVKYRYEEAFETLQARVPPGQDPWKTVTVAPADLADLGVDLSNPLTLLVHPSGRAVYVGSDRGSPVVIDGASGARVPPIDETGATTWVAGAIRSSPNGHRYGEPRSIRETQKMSAETGLQHPAYEIEFSGGKRVTIDRLTGQMAQTGDLNEWIDLTYKVHYLQWTPWPTVNIVLVLIAVPLVLLLAASGVRMFFTHPGK